MSTQVSLRIDTELVEFLDKEIAEGRARSRAAIVETALESERRRRLYEHDAEIYRRFGEDPELLEFHDWQQTKPFPDLDT